VPPDPDLKVKLELTYPDLLLLISALRTATHESQMLAEKLSWSPRSEGILARADKLQGMAELLELSLPPSEDITLERISDEPEDDSAPDD